MAGRDMITEADIRTRADWTLDSETPLAGGAVAKVWRSTRWPELTTSSTGSAAAGFVHRSFVGKKSFDAFDHEGIAEALEKAVRKRVSA